MKRGVFGILSAALILWFGLSGCQSCSCEAPETDGRDQAAQPPQPGPGDLRAAVESPGGPAEAAAGGPPRQKDNRAIDLSGMPLVEPVKPTGNSKAPPATLRITGYLKKLQEEERLGKGLEPGVPVPPVRPPSKKGGKKVRLSKKKPPRHGPKARPGKDVRRGPAGGPLH
jgi:hypothetical protein